MQPLTVVLLVILSVVLAYEATRLSILVSFRQNLLDLPNPRSSHAGPMPRVGGVGILSGFYLSMAALWWLGSWSPAVEATPTRALAVGLIAGGTMGLTGLYDDLHGLRFSAKLAIQSLLAAAVITVGMQLESVWLPLQPSVQLGVLSIPLTFIWLVAFPNVYNFMDGIDGLAGGTAVVYGVFFFLIAWGQGNPGAALVALVLAGSCFGFSLHNFPPARTFMGDTGSLFLGMLFALLVVWLAQATADPGCLVASLLVCSVFLYDSVFTVLRRLRYGENIFQAHRSHLYQRLVGAGLSHRTVTSLYLSLHVLVGCLALVYLRVPNAGRTVIVIVVLLLLLLHTRGVLWLEEHAQRRTESVVQSTEERQARDAERVGKEEEPL